MCSFVVDREAEGCLCGALSKVKAKFFTKVDVPTIRIKSLVSKLVDVRVLLSQKVADEFAELLCIVRR